MHAEREVTLAFAVLPAICETELRYSIESITDLHISW